MNRLTPPIAIAAILVTGFLGFAVAGGLSSDENQFPLVELPAAEPGSVGPAPNGGVGSRPVPIDPDDVLIRGGELQRVEAAALRVAGGGSVTDLERSDDPGEAYEVEVVKNGVELDIALDAELRRVPNTTYDD